MTVHICIQIVAKLILKIVYLDNIASMPKILFYEAGYFREEMLIN
jgi:hypothetical protein